MTTKIKWYLVTIFILGFTTNSVAAPVAKNSFYVSGKFYNRIVMHLECSFIKPGSDSFRANLIVRSIDTKDDLPDVRIDVFTSSKSVITEGSLKGLMTFSLPMSSAIQADLPIPSTGLYNQRFIRLLETFDFETNGTRYLATIGGTKEDLTAVEAVGFCSVGAIEGDLEKGS